MAPLLAPVISDLQCFLISSNLIRVERNRFNPPDPLSSWSTRPSQTHKSLVCHWKPSHLLTNCLWMPQGVRHGSIRSFRKAFQCLLGGRCALSEQEAEATTHLSPVNLSEASRSLSEEPLGLSATLGFKASPEFGTGCSPTLSWQDGEAASWLDGLLLWWCNKPHAGSHNT